MKANASLDMMRLAQHFAPTEADKNGFALVRHEMLERGEDDRSATLQLSQYLGNALNYGNWQKHDGPVEEPVMRVASPFELLVAQMVLDACTLQQNSYDHAAADAASAEMEAAEAQHNIDKPGVIFYHCVDYSKFYRIDLEVACEQVAGPLGRLIHLALEGWWNDTVDWAKKMLDPDAICAPGLYNCQHGVVWQSEVDDIETVYKDLCPKCTEFWKKQREEEHEKSGA